MQLLSGRAEAGEVAMNRHKTLIRRSDDRPGADAGKQVRRCSTMPLGNLKAEMAAPVEQPHFQGVRLWPKLPPNYL